MSSKDKPTRINRFLADCGLGSRRSCEQIIIEGRVTVNGEVCVSLATQIKASDEVVVDGKKLTPENTPINILLYKPQNYICTRNDPENRPTIFELLPKHLMQQRNIHYAGRLDYKSEGLIILTNSGDISQQLSHPNSKVEKEYLVTLSKPFNIEDRERLINGIEIPSGLAKVSNLEKVSKRSLAITLNQGLNRQIRYMMSALNYNVVRLIRVRIGELTDTSLKPGEWRFVGRKDLYKIFNTAKD